MGFNKRKMEDARRQEAEKEAAARRATDRQILEDAEQLVTAWNERQAKRMPMLFWRCHRGWLLVHKGALPGLPHYRRCRPADARLAPRRGRDGSYPGIVMSLLPPECAVRRIGVPVEVERGRGVFKRSAPATGG